MSTADLWRSIGIPLFISPISAGPNWAHRTRETSHQTKPRPTPKRPGKAQAQQLHGGPPPSLNAARVIPAWP